MSDEHTPTTEEIRVVYGTQPDELWPRPEGDPERVEDEAEFDRWLAAHDRRVAVETLRKEAAYFEEHDGSDWHYIEMENGKIVWAADCLTAHADAIEQKDAK